MQLDLTDEESAALVRELNSIIEDDRYPFSQRIRVLRVIQAKFAGCATGTAAGESADARRTKARASATRWLAATLGNALYVPASRDTILTISVRG